MVWLIPWEWQCKGSHYFLSDGPNVLECSFIVSFHMYFWFVLFSVVNHGRVTFGTVIPRPKQHGK